MKLWSLLWLDYTNYLLISTTKIQFQLQTWRLRLIEQHSPANAGITILVVSLNAKNSFGLDGVHSHLTTKNTDDSTSYPYAINLLLGHHSTWPKDTVWGSKTPRRKERNNTKNGRRHRSTNLQTHWSNKTQVKSIIKRSFTTSQSKTNAAQQHNTKILQRLFEHQSRGTEASKHIHSPFAEELWRMPLKHDKQPYHIAQHHKLHCRMCAKQVSSDNGPSLDCTNSMISSLENYMSIQDNHNESWRS